MKPYLYKNMFSLEGKTAIVTGDLGYSASKFVRDLLNSVPMLLLLI